ncbi:MAG: hypothetical protein ACI4XF_06190 [Oscillospiraceae bacterium]
MSIFGNQQYCPSCMAPVKSANAVCKECGFDPAAYPASARYLKTGTIINDRFLVGCVLSENAFSVSYMGLDLAEKKKKVIKEYCPYSCCSRINNEFEELTLKVNPDKEAVFKKGMEDFIATFKKLKELEAENELPGIAHITNVVEAMGTAYAISDHVEGTLLKKIVKNPSSKLSADEVFALMRPIISSMITIHANNIFHANISPFNILVTPDKKQAYLIGFGIYGVNDNDAAFGLIPKGGFTPLEEYSAFKGAIGGWTDIFGLCSTIYYALTGTTPPDAPDRTITDELETPSSLGITLSEDKDAALMQGLEVYERDRFKAVRALYNAMYSDDEEVVYSPDEPEPEAKAESAAEVKAEPAPEAKPEPEVKAEPAPVVQKAPDQGYSQVIVRRKNKENIEICGSRYSSKLTKLELDGQNVTDNDTDSIGDLTELEYLSLNDNKIGNIEFAGSLRKLISLSAKNNYITDISCLVNLGELRELYLGGNAELSDISVLEYLRGIRKLDLSNTAITDIHPLIYLDHLKSLNLKGTKITQRQIKALYAEMPTCDIRYDYTEKK